MGGLLEHAAVTVQGSHKKWRGEGEEERKEKREDKGVGKLRGCCGDSDRFTKEMARIYEQRLRKQGYGVCWLV